MLEGKCRYCRKPISWQYPFVEAFTGLSFFLVLYGFGLSVEGLAMLIFSSTLIAVTITDFRQKLIPHDITYLAMPLGIIYRSFFHVDVSSFKPQPLTFNPAQFSDTLLNAGFHYDIFLNTLAGIGISYIIFDFIDFYGAKTIIMLGGVDPDENEEKTDADTQDPQLDGCFEIIDDPPQQEEELIVMGGADAVLAAVIAAWLGMQNMLMAVLLAFLVGSLMGATYLFFDMKKRGVLKDCMGTGLKGAAIGAVVMAVPLIALMSMFGETESNLYPQLFCLTIIAAVCGFLLGALFSGSRFKHYFPFGPALACGAAIVMFHSVAGAFGLQWGIIGQGSFF